MKRASSVNGWSDAQRHLSGVDPVFERLVRTVGPCTLQPRRDYFPTLCRSIFSQQLSTKVAAALFGRYCDLFPRRKPTPALALELLRDQANARACGLSRQKTAYLLDLAAKFQSRAVPTRRFAAMEDQQIIEALVEVDGIGRWTAEMFLMFVLNRPDVLPVDDLGLREGVRELYDLEQRPTPSQVREISQPWAPYRTVATWYIWRRGNKPT